MTYSESPVFKLQLKPIYTFDKLNLCKVVDSLYLFHAHECITPPAILLLISFEKIFPQETHAFCFKLAPSKSLVIIYLPPCCSNDVKHYQLHNVLFLRISLLPFCLLLFLYICIYICIYVCIPLTLFWFSHVFWTALLKILEPEKYITFWLPYFALKKLWIFISDGVSLWLSY